MPLVIRFTEIWPIRIASQRMIGIGVMIFASALFPSSHGRRLSMASAATTPKST
jgi:hypothetical protein